MAFTAKFDPEIPQELRAMPPRMARWRWGGGARSAAGFLVVGIVFGGVGLAVLIFCVGEPIFLAVSLTTDARITSLNIIHGKGITYDVQYRYLISGNQVEGSDSVDQKIYARLQVGQAITVRAAMLGPWPASEIPRRNYFASRWFLWLWTIGWNGFVLKLLYNGVIIPRRLVREGTAVLGQIVGKKMMRGRSTVYRLRYEYQPMGGDTITRTMDVTRKNFDAISEGQQAVILYDPMKPKRSTIYDYCSYQAAGAILLGG
jgi:hypothetical protein